MSRTPPKAAELSPQEKRALLAQLLRKKASASRSAPLSFAQQRLWFLDRLEPGGPAYNVPLAVRLAGPLDAAALERSLDALVRRHEILRTTFAAGETGEPVQVIAPAMKLSLAARDVEGVPEGEREAAALR